MAEEVNRSKFSPIQQLVLNRLNHQYMQFDDDETILCAKYVYEIPLFNRYWFYGMFYGLFLLFIGPPFLYVHLNNVNMFYLYDILLGCILILGFYPAMKLKNILTTITLYIFTNKATYLLTLSRKAATPEKLKHQDLDYCNCFVRPKPLNKKKYIYRCVFGVNYKDSVRFDCKTLTEFQFFKNVLQQIYFRNAKLFQNSPVALKEFPHIEQYKQNMIFKPEKVKIKKATRMKRNNPFYIIFSLIGGIIGIYKLSIFIWELAQQESDSYVMFIFVFLGVFLVFSVIMVIFDNWRYAVRYLKSNRDHQIELTKDQIKRIINPKDQDLDEQDVHILPFKQDLTYETFETRPRRSPWVGSTNDKSYKLTYFTPSLSIEDIVELDDIDDFQYGFQWKYYHWLEEQNYFLEDHTIESAFANLTPNDFNETLKRALLLAHDAYSERNQTYLSQIQQHQQNQPREKSYENHSIKHNLYPLNDYRKNLEENDEIQSIFRSGLSFKEYLDMNKVKRVGIILGFLIIDVLIFGVLNNQGLLDDIGNFMYIFTPLLFFGILGIMAILILIYYVIFGANLNYFDYLSDKKQEYVLTNKTIQIRDRYDFMVIPFEKIKKVVYTKPTSYYVPKIMIFLNVDSLNVKEREPLKKVMLKTVPLKSPIFKALIEIGMVLG
ncbi:hypothetical protein DSAG12_02672 [Promethearchaeum syntrophicum]|uniref:Uncharacterized protein n=1 Tax=Promethearchaeum syntrophicum TaxID=2594042 RepID=A0A5B9DCK2_9ARCH|nr:hypothetical protein [Candidatus Prometheoarchaeum syntrophicum]QEE16842.1 hypothetical protein DSAG12_02672 [Candidatus Prometheoarchaeum syntrophicum]